MTPQAMSVPMAISDGVATALIAGISAGGSFALVLSAMMISLRRSRRRDPGRSDDAAAAHDPYPRQPYSPAEPGSHQPYSRPYKVARRQAAHGATNGSRPSGADGSGGALLPWAPPDED